MFERYTETARRVIFYARSKASLLGGARIETEHLLLGLLREDEALVKRFCRSDAKTETIRTEVEARDTGGERVFLAKDMPLTHQTKRVLAYAAEESGLLNHNRIRPLHLLAGLLREENGLAAEILRERGVQLASVRDELARSSEEDALGAG